MFFVLNHEGSFSLHFFLATICSTISCVVTFGKLVPLNRILEMSEFRYSSIYFCTSGCRIELFNLENYRSFVNDLTILFSAKNSFKITFKAVYVGTATTIPVIPNNNPPMIMIKKISNGCDFTLFENITG